MSATTVTMTPDEAREFRARHDAEALRLSHTSKAALAIEESRLMGEQGSERIYGGPFSKDELISSVLELRGFGTARMNQVIHTLYHDVVWPDCPHCAGGAA